MNKDLNKLKIVFYDGNCGLCQRSIEYLYASDKKAILYFAPLNGITYENIYKSKLDDLTTLKFFNENKSYEKSEAFLELSWLLGGRFKYLYIFKIIPAYFRDKVYDLVASRRKLISCVIIPKNERFLP